MRISRMFPATTAALAMICGLFATPLLVRGNTNTDLDISGAHQIYPADGNDTGHDRDSSGAPFASRGDQVLYSFQGFSDGALPYSDVIADSSGNVYGTTPSGGGYGGGAVYELFAPASAGEKWTEAVIYGFQPPNDVSIPYGRLVFDHAGNLYGTTISGGNGYGSVFMLAPPAVAGGAWIETVLYNFQGGSDGSYPYAGLAFDNAGNLYGTTESGGSFAFGTVFELKPPATPGGSWSETVLHSFSSGSGDGATPYAGVIFDKSGKMYGTTLYGGAFGSGVVYQMSPPPAQGAPWMETVLHGFTGGTDGAIPVGGLILDRSGDLFGTTQNGGNSSCEQGCGTVFKLTGPKTRGGAWRESILYSFMGSFTQMPGDGAYPTSELVFDEAGNLYGTTLEGGDGCDYGCGTVFQLRPPANAGGVWSESILHDFLTSVPDGAVPHSGLTFGKGGALYGTAVEGGNYTNGVVYSLAP